MATALRDDDAHRSDNEAGLPPSLKGPPGLPGQSLDHALEFMCDEHKAYFRDKLLAWKSAIQRETGSTRAQLQNGPLREPDANDRASSETDWSIELRTRDRQRKLITKIDAALRRLDSGEYGYCEVTGEAISLARLDARPVATMTVEAQERHERREKVFRE